MNSRRLMLFPGSGADIVTAQHDLKGLDVRFGCAPWKGGVFQWVQAPLGDRSSRKQSEQSWR